MNVVFYISAAIAIIATILVITRLNAMHALLYLIISFLAVSLMFFTLGAPFIAALEVIIYAGAIMVLFIFAIMLLNLGEKSVATEKQWLQGNLWIGPVILSIILLVEVIYILTRGGTYGYTGSLIEPQQVGALLFSTYLIGVELGSILLLASLVGAYHLGQARRKAERDRNQLAGKGNSSARSATEETPGNMQQKSAQ